MQSKAAFLDSLLSSPGDIIARFRDKLASPDFPIIGWALRITFAGAALQAVLWLRLFTLLFGQSTGGLWAPFFWLSSLLVEPWRWLAASHSVRDTGFFEFACFVAIDGYTGLTLVTLGLLFATRYWATHSGSDAEEHYAPPRGIDLRPSVR